MQEALVLGPVGCGLNPKMAPFHGMASGKSLNTSITSFLSLLNTGK